METHSSPKHAGKKDPCLHRETYCCEYSGLRPVGCSLGRHVAMRHVPDMHWCETVPRAWGYIHISKQDPICTLSRPSVLHAHTDGKVIFWKPSVVVLFCRGQHNSLVSSLCSPQPFLFKSLQTDQACSLPKAGVCGEMATLSTFPGPRLAV